MKIQKMKAIESVRTIDGDHTPYAGFAFDDDNDDDGTEYDESEEEVDRPPPPPERKKTSKKEAPIRNWRKKYNTIMKLRTELKKDDDDDDDASSRDGSIRDMTIESRDSSGYGSFRFDDTLKSSDSRVRVDTTMEIPEKKKSMTNMVTSDVNSTYGSFKFDDTLKSSDSRVRVDTTIEIPEKKKSMTNMVTRTTSDVNSTYGSFKFDDTLNSKDVSLVSKLRNLVERMDFMEKSVMVRLDRIEKRLTRLEEEKNNTENEDEDQQREIAIEQQKTNSVIKMKLRKVMKKKKRSTKRKKKKNKKSTGEIRVHATVRASKKIYSTDPKTHLHAKAGDEFQVLRVHKDEGKLFVMNKRTWKKGFIPHEDSLDVIS